jgi:hypothetical protein
MNEADAFDPGQVFGDPRVRARLRQSLAETAVDAFQEIRAVYQARVGANPWIIVGVSPDDPPALIDDVYRAKAKHLHPDVQGTGNEIAFKRLEAAHEAVKQHLEQRAKRKTVKL